jgi:hypothetical protein
MAAQGKPAVAAKDRNINLTGVQLRTKKSGAARLTG